MRTSAFTSVFAHGLIYLCVCVCENFWANICIAVQIVLHKIQCRRVFVKHFGVSLINHRLSLADRVTEGIEENGSKAVETIG